MYDGTYWVHDSRNRVEHIGYTIPDTGLNILGTRCQVQCGTYRVRDARYGVEYIRYTMSNTGLKLLGTQYQMLFNIQGTPYQTHD